MLIYNEDTDFRFYLVEAGTMTAEKLDINVDGLDGSGVGLYLVCPNCMKANFPSKVLETFTDGFDANLGMDQKCFNGEIGEWGYRRAANIQALERHGIDSNAYLLDRARKKGFGTGVTVRMNDHHGCHLKRSLFMGDYYFSHPELLLENVPREPIYDYSHPEVRERMTRFVAEVMDRYEPDWIDIDWLRHLPHFEPGQGKANAGLVTEMMADIRHAADAREKKFGHRIRICGTVPSKYELAVYHGLDAAVWADRGLIDVIILGQLLFRNGFIDPASWRPRLADRAFPVAVRIECFQNAYPGGPRLDSPRREIPGAFEKAVCFTRGAAWSAYHRGADHLEFFNYHRVRHDPVGRKLFADCASRESLRGKERWSAVCYDDVDMPCDLYYNGWRQPGVFEKYMSESLADGSYPYALPRRIGPGKREKFLFPSGPVPEENACLRAVFSGVPADARVSLGGVPGVCREGGWDFPAGTKVESDAVVEVVSPPGKECYVTEAVLQVRFPEKESE